MSSLLSKLFRSTRPPHRSRPRLGVEHLDRRDLPAGISLTTVAVTPPVLFSTYLTKANRDTRTGTLTVTGTDLDDRIALTENPFVPVLNMTGVSRFTIDGVTQTSTSVASSRVRFLVVDLKDGNDTFTLSRSQRLTVGLQQVANPAYDILQAITATGGAGNDTIDLSGANPAPASVAGQAGDDTLHGGPGNDTLVGGIGRDTLYGNGGDDGMFAGEVGSAPFSEVFNYLDGGAGNDSLFASRGTNHLLGGLGNDSLYGGGGFAPEFTFMTGGAGADRYLTQSFRNQFDANVPRDVIVGREAADAVIRLEGSFNAAFVYRGWSEMDVVWADAAFKRVVDRTGTTRLLKLANGGDVTFRRLVSLPASPGNVTLGDNDSAGLIRITDAGIADINTLGRTIVHELGHNYDTQAELNALPGRPSWTAWQNLSGWRAASGMTPAGRTRSLDGAWTYLNSAQFARTYGRTDPQEDFSTSWEAYFYNGIGTTRVAAKQTYLDGFFNAAARA